VHVHYRGCSSTRHSLDLWLYQHRYAGLLAFKSARWCRRTHHTRPSLSEILRRQARRRDAGATLEKRMPSAGSGVPRCAFAQSSSLTTRRCRMLVHDPVARRGGAFFPAPVTAPPASHVLGGPQDEGRRPSFKHDGAGSGLRNCDAGRGPGWLAAGRPGRHHSWAPP